MYNSLLDRIIFFFVALVLAVRILIGSTFLNSFIGYTNGQGSVAGRFHPGTYLLLIPSVLYLIRNRFRFYISLDISIVLLGIAAIVAMYNGGFNIAAIIVDAIMSAALVGRFVAGSSQRYKDAYLLLFVTLLLFNLPVVIYEYATSSEIIPRNHYEHVFRPHGFFDHPLTAGWVCCFAMWAVYQSTASRSYVIFVNACLFVEVVLCGVRMPLIMATFLLYLTIVKFAGSNLSGRISAAMVGLALVPVIIITAASLGLLGRFIELGLFDDSASTRIQSWSIIGSLSRAEIWSGLTNDMIEAKTTANGVDIVENSFVALLIAAGIVPAIICHLAIFLAPLAGWIRRPSYLLLLFSVLAATISLSTKSAVPLVAIFTAMLYRRDP